ncbi:hypothetical protein [Nocardia asiatica]|uniref:hypothetical protein n=1 Tax=Nocardia asiatica TaxID=209252 RepID=UPI0024554961|nr:hypothetical protein [Nocardia asiatica]
MTDPFWMPREFGGEHRGCAGLGPADAVPSTLMRDVIETTGIRDPAAAVVPGETQEVPVLEKPPVIGVVEVVDGPSRASMITTHTLSTSSANPSEAR